MILNYKRTRALNWCKIIITKDCKLGIVADTGIVEVLDEIMSKKSKLLELLLLLWPLLAIKLGVWVVDVKLSSNDNSWSILLDWVVFVGLIVFTGNGWMLVIK